MFKWVPVLHLSRMFVSARCEERRLKVAIAAAGLAQVASADLDLGPVWRNACKFFSQSLPHPPCPNQTGLLRWDVQIDRSLRWCNAKPNCCEVWQSVAGSKTRFWGHTWQLPIWTTSQFNPTCYLKYLMKAHQPNKPDQVRQFVLPAIYCKRIWARKFLGCMNERMKQAAVFASDF